MLIGKRLGGRYQILKIIGGGGMSQVYLAKDLILEREVAVKVLRLEYAGDDDFIRRFRREAQNVATLLHPNVVETYDVGEENQIYYIVMEYVHGQTLKEYIHERGHLTVEETVIFMEQLLSAVDEAHKFGIIHRDIKPQNILVRDDGVLKITDFGIAIASTSTTITQTNTVLGSVHYLSPEQARGGIANKQSDIYSLGMVMYEMLIGHPPFEGETVVSIALRHLQEETPSLRKKNSSIPQSIENIVLQATTKDVFYRFKTVSEMKGALLVALKPEHANDPKFTIAMDQDKTMAIPIITDDTLHNVQKDETMISPVTKTTPSPTKEQVKEEQVALPTKKIVPPKKDKQHIATPKEQKQKKKRKWLKYVIGAIMLLAVATVAAITVIPGIMQPKEIEIPDVANERYDQAFTKLKNLGFDVQTQEETSEEIEENFIIRTFPEAGEMAKEGTEITIYKSVGKERIELQSYVGETYSDTFIDELTQLFKDVKVNFVNEEGKSNNEIVSQSPDPMEKIVPKDTVLYLNVHREPTYEMLDFIGKDVFHAENFKSYSGVKLKIKYEDNKEYEKGIVTKQKPKAGTVVKKGDVIELTVSNGAKLKTKTVTYAIPMLQEEPPEETPEGEESPPPVVKSQLVEIYLTDHNHDGSTPIISEEITEERPFTVEVEYEDGSAATIKVMINGELYKEDSIK